MQSNASPLISLDVVALDLETTGLDPRTARIVEVGAVRFVGGGLDQSAPTYRALVRPGEPIPASATRIHGIDQSKVASALMFAHTWPDFSSYLADSVVIGHTIGFDLAVLKHECERTGQAFHVWAALDVRLLAQVCEPNLAGYSLEDLAAWLNVEISGRHSALGDATSAARIFCALLPHLRARGIRTLGEALRSCRVLTEASNPQRPAIWPSMASELPAAGGQIPRVDASLYRQRVADIMSAPARSVSTGASVGQSLGELIRERISSVFIVSDSADAISRPERVGIVTERDILRAIDTLGPAALAWPVERIMNRPLRCIDSSAFAYQAVARMNRLNVRHLGVTNGAGAVIGALSARDLLRLRAQEAAELGDAIDQGRNVHELARAWGRISPVCEALLEEGLSASDVASVISNELAQLTRRAVTLAEEFMRDSGQGGPPSDYAILLLGSAGRGESLLALDQDSALVYADDAPESADRWFETLAVCFSRILHEVGVPYCKGGVMASNTAWRGSMSVWRQRIEGWVRRSSSQDLLAVDIFFDMQGVHGSNELADALRGHAFAAVRGQAAFAKLLVEAAGVPLPWRNWFGGWRTENGRIDLKRTGLFGIVSRARALAICHGVTERSTVARIEGVKALQLGSESDLDSMIESYGLFLDLILKQQLADIEDGQPPSNAVAVKSLPRRDRDRMRAALQNVEHLDRLTQDLLFRA